MNLYRTDMAVLAFTMTLVMFFLAQYLQLSAMAQAWTQTLSGLPSNDPGHRYGQGKSGGVASESSVCSQIGIDLLKQGGNAADAVRTFDLIEEYRAAKADMETK